MLIPGFQLFEAFLYTGTPTTPIPYIPRCYIDYNNVIDPTTGAPNLPKVRAAVAAALASRATLIAFDVEAALANKIDQTQIGQSGGPSSQEDIDARLSAIPVIFRECKSLAPNLQVGFYGLQIRSYFIPVNAIDKSTNLSTYTDWLAAHSRFNKRWRNGALVDGFPLHPFFDFAITDIYTFYGPSNPHDPTYIRENCRAVSTYVSQGMKPNYAITWPYGTYGPFLGRPYPSGEYDRILREASKWTSGAIAWGGFAVSATTNTITATPSPIASWTALPSSSPLTFRYGGIDLTATCTFAGAADLANDVKGILSVAINAAITSYNALVPTVSSDPGYSPSRPFTLQPITVGWTGTAFTFTSPALAAPLDNYYARDLAFTGNGTVNALLSNATQTVSGRTTNEFATHVLNQPWYNELTTLATPPQRATFPPGSAYDSRLRTMVEEQKLDGTHGLFLGPPGPP